MLGEGDGRRKKLYTIMNLMETEQSVLPVLSEEPNDDLEDITDELLNAVDNDLGDLELICSKAFSFEETMSAIEVMDVKMDIRM